MMMKISQAENLSGNYLDNLLDKKLNPVCITLPWQQLVHSDLNYKEIVPKDDFGNLKIKVTIALA